VTNLRCEYRTNPLGIDSLHPRLSWVIESTRRAQTQRAYRILASSNLQLLSAGRADLWDTGKVHSDETAQISYAGKPLFSGERVYYSVQSWDNAGRPSPWSDAAWWEMALLKPENWKAAWIEQPLARSDSGPPDSAAPYFRKGFTLAGPVRAARAYFCGLGYGELYLNGQKVGDHVLSPAQTDYDHRLLSHLSYPIENNLSHRTLYETYDVTSFLKAGPNACGVIIGNGWFAQRERRVEGWLDYGSPRMILQLDIQLEDGRQEILGSDGTWKVSTGPITANSIFRGEDYDARLEKEGWDRAGFDDSDWSSAQTVPAPLGPLHAQGCPPDRVLDTVQPAAETHPNPDTARYDMGRNIAGWVRLKVQGPAGAQLKLRFISEEGEDYGQRDSYTLRGPPAGAAAPEVWEPRFTWHGFRTVEISGLSQGVTLRSVEGRVVHTDVESAGQFSCSNPLINGIQTLYLGAELSNLHGGVPSDCPHRERLGYTGDGQITCEAAMDNFRMDGFYTKWMDDIADAQNQRTGFVPHTAPFGGGGGGPPWGSACVILPWRMYQQYGDRLILEAHYAGMKHWVQYLTSRTDKDGIVTHEEPGGWDLGEWATPGPVQVPAELVNTCYYALCAQLTARTAAVLGHPDEQEAYNKIANDAGSAVNRRFYNPSAGQYSIGRQGADVFPLAFGLTPTGQEGRVLDSIVQNVARNGGRLDTGIMGTPLLLDVLSDAGRTDLAYAILTQTTFPSYGNMIAKGATTLWENWDGSGSHDHPMFGSVSAWFYRRLAGINPDPAGPGFKKIIIRPEPVGDLTWAGADYQSIHGTIRSHWTRKGGLFQLGLEFPANTTATLYLPGIVPGQVTESGKLASRADGVRFLRVENGRTVWAVGSGEYHFGVTGGG
nr:glycoside hydrolase family 78 protein [Armatimonadota bacterium]